MKSNTHPQYYSDAKITCSCGHVFTLGSTIKDIHVEICSHCHPFFTGEMRFVDTQGRVEKFEALRARAAKLQTKKKKVASNKSPDDAIDSPKTLREMLEDVAAEVSPEKKSVKTSKSSESSK